jgi:hypothetical protein
MPDELPDPIAVAAGFVAVLDQLGIPYVIGGSLASSVHGEPRSTNDVGVVADVSPAHVPDLVRALAPSYYISEDSVRTAVQEATSFNAVHLGAAVKIDVFVVGRDAFDRERIATGQRMEIAPGQALVIDSPENTVLRKLEWFRRGGEVSERQWRDIVGILRVQGDRLDQDRLRRWANTLRVADLLDRAQSR